MDLIYMNSRKEDIGVLKDHTFDLAYGKDENDFECKVALSDDNCKGGWYLYIENTEYGGIIDKIKVDTKANEIAYKGKTWQGILNSKVLEPDTGEDYLVVSGEANSVMGNLISRLGLSALFMASGDDSGVNIASYKMNRYIKGYDGIKKMLKTAGAKLNIVFKNGFVELSAKPVVDYSKDEQFDTDQIEFVVEKNYRPINHVICLGKGELSEREVIHLYADKNGNVGTIQSLFGMDEVTEIYENTNAESTDDLVQGGIEIIQKSFNSDNVNFDFEANKETYDIGDIVGAKEKKTGVEASSEITKKIVAIKNNKTTISYEVGE